MYLYLLYFIVERKYVIIDSFFLLLHSDSRYEKKIIAKEEIRNADDLLIK